MIDVTRRIEKDEILNCKKGAMSSSSMPPSDIVEKDAVMWNFGTIMDCDRPCGRPNM